MLLILLILAITGLIVGSHLYRKNNDEPYSDDKYSGLLVTSVLSTVITVLIILLGIGVISIGMSANYKMEIYQEENKKIETSIITVIENYKDYEKDLFKDIKSENIISVATEIYPDLKSNKLIDNYIENNNQIKALKKECANAKVAKFWLYFGG